jgi:parallel beta-helix repeat protein
MTKHTHTNQPKPAHKPKHGLFRNMRPSLLIMLVPVLVGLFVAFFLFSSRYNEVLGWVGSQRLTTQNWETADKVFQENQPDYERKFAYYRLRERQDLTKTAEFFSVDQAQLAALNPGTLVANTTVKVPPVQHPLAPITAPNGKIFGSKVLVENGIIRVINDYKFDPVITNLPELATFLGSHGALTEVAPKVWRVNKPISIEDNIRIDITGETAKKVELRSAPDDIVCLCFDGAAALIKDTVITSYDPATGQPDKKYEDQRSFIRAKSGRMDIVNSHISYLGNGLIKVLDETKKPPIQRDGGTYGISWRIPDDRLGVDITTGWVEGTTFYRNHFGSYTYGASGMMWRNNHFLENDVYGLDPHDDSNNALVENNVFERNGKHGFIVSKRCNYNIIRNNTSFGNKLHGFMLHQDSAYNLIENNVSYDNTDNYVIYASDYNTIRNNVGYNARASHVRINQGARNTYVTNNKFYGGRRGIFVYGNSHNVYATNNEFRLTKEVLSTEGAQNVLFASNSLHGLLLSAASGDRLIFGPNVVERSEVTIPAEPPRPKGFTADKIAKELARKSAL